LGGIIQQKTFFHFKGASSDRATEEKKVAELAGMVKRGKAREKKKAAPKAVKSSSGAFCLGII
jgi:hypothetical protein